MAHAWLRTRSRRDHPVVEAEKWIRFRNYLAGLKTYGDLAAVQQILDRHFAYVVALGVEQEVLSYAEAVGASRPAWLILPASATRGPGPVFERADTKRRGTMRPRNGLTRVAARSSVRRGQSSPKSPGQSLGGLSRTLGASLAAASANVGNLLSTAVGQTQGTRPSVTLSSPMRTRAMEWEPNTPVSQIMDDIMSQSIADARAIQAKRSSQATRKSPPVTAGSRSRSQFRSSGGFRPERPWTRSIITVVTRTRLPGDTS